MLKTNFNKGFTDEKFYILGAVCNMIFIGCEVRKIPYVIHTPLPSLFKYIKSVEFDIINL